LSCTGDPPALIRFDNTGMKAEGYHCDPTVVVGGCGTDLVVYVAGSGFKRFTETVPYGSTCSGGTFVDFDGTGFKTRSVSSWTCQQVA